MSIHLPILPLVLLIKLITTFNYRLDWYEDCADQLIINFFVLLHIRTELMDAKG